MSTQLFPMIQPQAWEGGRELPLCVEIGWDYAANQPRFLRGEPVEVQGLDAVLVWAWKALHTERFRYEIYTWAYGSELESLIGQPYTGELKRAEAIRYVREALLINPYIRSVDDISVTFLDGLLEISCALTSIYGKGALDAHV